MRPPLYPAGVKIFYHSQYADHVMTRPTTAWSPPAGGFAAGSFLSWSSMARDADDMVKDLCTAMAPLMQDESAFDSYIIYTQASPTDTPVFATTGAINIAGTGSLLAGQEKAAQSQYSMIDSGGHRVSFYMLDAPNPAGFDRIDLLGDLTTEEQDLLTEFMDEDNAWSSRADMRPSTFRRATYKINDALRRRYRMA